MRTHAACLSPAVPNRRRCADLGTNIRTAICGGDNIVNGSFNGLITIIEGDNNSAVFKNYDASDQTVGFFAIVGNTCIKRQILAGREPNLFFCDKQRNGNRVI